MKINSIKINGFGKVQDKDIKFNDGINIIYGKNESGKTTIQKFIFSMFYGLSKTKNGKDVSDFDKYKPWDDIEFSGKIKYTLSNNKKFEVFREFKKKKPQIYNEFGEDISDEFKQDKTKGIDYFVEQINFDENSFVNTLMTEQQCIKLEKNDTNAMIQKISNLVSTGDDTISYKKSMDKINKAQNDNIGNERTKNKPINIVNDNVKKLKNKKNEFQIYRNNTNNFIYQKNQLNDKIKNLQEKKEKLKEKNNKINNQVNEKKIQDIKLDFKKKVCKILSIIFSILALLSILIFKNIAFLIVFIVLAILLFCIDKNLKKSDIKENDFSIQDINNKFIEIDSEINEMKVQIVLLENERKNIDEKLSELVKIEEELEEQESIKKDLIDLDISYNLAKDCLEKAYDEIKHNISPKFEQKLCEIVSNITNEKYKNISFNDEKGLIVEVENGSYMPVDRLSIGTIDEMYLALRLSMLSEICNESMPIILDEVFAYFDDERLENILYYLQDKNYDNQIIIFTCSNREENLLNKLKIEYNLISLEK